MHGWFCPRASAADSGHSAAASASSGFAHSENRSDRKADFFAAYRLDLKAEATQPAAD